ncbi:MAG: hypothetical protein K2I42_06405 [Anaeroplasmataceae bacterium]|nr:hypothetical protein [Anaeroplasmataceae bacterium]
MKAEKNKNKTNAIKKTKEDKFKEKLKEFNQNIEDLKNTYPDADFSQIEELLLKMENATSTSLSSSFSFKGFLKRIGIMIVTFILYIIGISAIFGLFCQFINYSNPIHLLFCIFGLALIMYCAPIIISFIGFFSKSHFLDIFLSIGLIIILAFIDQTFLHVCSRMLDSIVILFVVFLAFEFLKAYYIIKLKNRR